MCLPNIEIPSIDLLLTNEVRVAAQQDSLKKIQEAISENHVTMVLGAGVSIPANMPNWQGLISQMLGYAMQYRNYFHSYTSPDLARERKLQKELISKELKILRGANTLESGQYIRQVLELAVEDFDDELLKEIINAIIEKNLGPKEFLTDYKNNHPELDLQNGGSATQRILATESTLCAVSYLIKEKVHRALTYNYDTLVQEYMSVVFQVPEDSIVTHAGKWTKTECQTPIEIFHVHGYLPRKSQESKPTPMFPVESSELIFSEDSYYNTEQYEAYNWQNSIQSYYLNRDHCVFVGFSADDYNFRRILKQLGKKGTGRPEHYLILAVDDVVRDTWESICQHGITTCASIDDIKNDTLVMLDQILDMKEKYWRRYGFYPVWTTVKDIPKLILSLDPTENPV